MGELLAVLTAPERGAAMIRQDRGQVVAGHGLAGDRYYHGRGTFSGRLETAPGARQLSLIATEAVATCGRRLGAPVDAAALRRNLVIQGLDLRALIGGELCIGAVRLRVVATCPPCGHLARLTGLDARAGLRGIGGVRAAVLAGGTLRAGDAVTPA